MTDMPKKSRPSIDPRASNEPEPQRTVAWHIGRAAESFEDQDFASAIIELTAALRIEPANAPARINRANAYGILREHHKALADLEAVLNENLSVDDRAEALSLRGRTNAQLHRDEQAEHDLTAALRLKPRHRSARTWRSKVRLVNEQWAQCLADCTELIELIEPPDAADFWRRGVCYENLERPEEALADFNRAIDASPNLWRAFLSRALLHHDAARYVEAIADFSAVLKLRPDYVTGLCCRAECHLESGRADLALRDCDEAMRIEPGSELAKGVQARALAARDG